MPPFLRLHACLSHSVGLAGLVLFALLAAPAAYAQGKIAGTVVADNGEPLPGVNVVIDGTQQGTTTNVDGNYVIVNVRPGEYTLVFSFIGFQTRRVEGVQVVTGQTTEVDQTMSEEVIQGEEVIVRAERPLVQKDLTASRKTVNAEEIEALPVESFFGVLSTQAGVTTGADGSIHIRGGRANEVAYLVDGMSVGNPFETNGLATEVATEAIQEMTVISGAFNAEYGKAMSGIVNLVTKEGGSEYEGSISFYGGDTFTGREDIFYTPEGVTLNDYTLEGSLSGPVWPGSDRLRFFASGRRDVDQGHIFGPRRFLPGDSANFNPDPDRLAQVRAFLPEFDPELRGTPVYYEMHGRPWWMYEDHRDPATGEMVEGLPLPAERVALNDNSSYNVLGKLTWRPFQGGKIAYQVLLDGSERRPYSFSYRFNPDGLGRVRDWSQNHSLHWTHTLGERAFYTLRASYADNAYRRYTYEDPTDARYVKDLSDTGAGLSRGVPSYNFLFGGNQKTHIYEDSRSLRGKLDLTRQFGVIHEVKAGLDVQIHELERENFAVLFTGRPPYPTATVPPIQTSSHDKYGCTDYIRRFLSEADRALYDQATDGCEPQRVIELAAYAQDKLEFDNFVINAGLRFERFDPNGLAVANVLAPVQPDGSANLIEAETKNMLLPRLGVSFPITEQGIIHFSYGHFVQMPRLRNMYLNPEFEFPVDITPLFGNANMRPERTAQYEVGLQQQLSDVLAFNVTGFFKDIRDYLAPFTFRFGDLPEQVYTIYQNRDYANVQGLTFSLTKRRAPGGLVSATVDYTFQTAEGNETLGDAFFYNAAAGRENELVVVPLDFDQRHVLSSTVSVSRPGNWGVSFIGQYSTGYPYSPLLIDQQVDLDQHSGRKPTQLLLDARLFKQFDLGPLQLRAFAKIFNLLDRLNERFVFDETGRADYSLSDELNRHAAWRSFYSLPGVPTLADYDTRPHWYSAPREIRLGLTMAF